MIIFPYSHNIILNMYLFLENKKQKIIKLTFLVGSAKILLKSSSESTYFNWVLLLFIPHLIKEKISQFKEKKELNAIKTLLLFFLYLPQKLFSANFATCLLPGFFLISSGFSWTPSFSKYCLIYEAFVSSVVQSEGYPLLSCLIFRKRSM